MPKGKYVRKPRKDKRKIPVEMPEPLKSPNALTIKRDPETKQFLKGTGSIGPRNKNTATLAALIRQIGEEPLEGSAGWSRIEAVVRTTYIDAMNGDNRAREIIMERGWGKVATPVEVDFKGQFLTVSRDMGLTQEDILNDPLLAMLAQSSDVMLENLPVTTEAPERGQNQAEYARKIGE